MEVQEAMTAFLWSRLDKAALKSSEYKRLYRRYLDILPALKDGDSPR